MNIPVGATKKHSYSEDENMYHISYESGELEDPAYPGHHTEGGYPGLVLKKKSVSLLDAPDVPARLTIDFEQGNPVRVRNVDDDAKTGFMKAMPEYGGKLTLHAADMTVEGA